MNSIVNNEHQTYYKYKITRKEDNETKLFFKYNELKEYCGIPRSTLYKIFNGAKPTSWVSRYTFEKVKLPRFQVKPIEY